MLIGHSLGIKSPLCPENVTSDGIEPEKDWSWGNSIGIWWTVTILLCLLVAREALQFSVNPTQYLSSIENVLEIMLMVLTFVLLLNGPPDCNIDFKREIATFVLLISWILLVTLIGKNLCNLKANSKF